MYSYLFNNIGLSQKLHYFTIKELSWHLINPDYLLKKKLKKALVSGDNFVLSNPSIMKANPSKDILVVNGVESFFEEYFYGAH